MYSSGRKVMNISKDTNGIFYLKWDGGDHGIDEEITDPNDPRAYMHYEKKVMSNGNIKYFYGVRLSHRRSGRSIVPYIHMEPMEYTEDAYIPDHIKHLDPNSSKTVIMKQKKDGQWWAVLKSMIRITI